MHAAIWTVLAASTIGLGSGPEFTTAQSKSGITCRLNVIEASVRISSTATGQPAAPACSLQITARVTAPQSGPIVFPTGMEIKELTGSDGKSLLAASKRPDRERPTPRRTDLARTISNMFMNPYDQEHHLSDSAYGMASIPDVIGSLRAKVHVLAATKISRVPVKLQPHEEPLAIAEGVTLLITNAAVKGPQFTCGYEVRIKRDRDATPESPQLSPLFVGLALQDENGRTANIFQPQEEIETRDEFIIVLKDISIDADFFRRIKAVEAVVVEDVHIVEFEVGASDLKLGG